MEEPSGLQNFLEIVTKPDNIPIVAMLILVIFFTWLGLRQALKNDKLIEEGREDEPRLRHVFQNEGAIDDVEAILAEVVRPQIPHDCMIKIVLFFLTNAQRLCVDVDASQSVTNARKVVRPTAPASCL